MTPDSNRRAALAPAATLLIVDVQARLFPAIYGANRVLDNCQRLLGAARVLGVECAVTEQNPRGLGHSVEALELVRERRFVKSHFNACREPEFLAWAHARPPGIVVAGTEAHVCVLQTTLGLLDAGRAPLLVADAIGSRDDANRLAAIERLRSHGVEIVTTEMVMFEWLQSSDHPDFRQVLKMLK